MSKNIMQLRAESTEILKRLYGSDATFRDGQYEAIEATMTNRRTLVVQRTGWGKSLVYFICTKLLRDMDYGVTMVVSPLLVLMENQLDAARKIGLRCDVLNSTVKREQRENILSSIKNNELDLILVTPETLFSENVQSALPDIQIGLFVIDEAHCISDWGHDFRLEYGNLKKVISKLPENVPILATTATANDRVIKDLCTQLGNNVFISRGPLTRESLHIQVLNMPSRVERYAWMIENIPKLDGCGIIYCLTRRDCDYLAKFLKENNISSAAYYSRSGEDGEKLNRSIEKQFQNNKLKAIVATVKLGMGYDKGDISFVIHYQMPSNIVSYYQQIGRAGRNIDSAYIFLMYGNEDEDILNYFINTAFPTEKETEQIMKLIGKCDGIKLHQIVSQLNIRKNRIDKALSFLQNDGYIRKDNGFYYIVPKKYTYDYRRYNEITSTRKKEMEQMKKLASIDTCYSKYIVSCLDDKDAHDCGKCANCRHHEILPSRPSTQYLNIAKEYVDGLIIEIEPRKQWASSSVTQATNIVYKNEIGICLSKYGDDGYGKLVKEGKYSAGKRFCDELVGKSSQVLRPYLTENNIRYVCAVPSLRSNIVKDFAERLAASLDIQFLNLLEKSSAEPQKRMENSSFQCENAFKSFHIRNGATVSGNILLVDDIVDSRWTLTVCGYRLMEAGAEKVFPFALADSSNRED